MIAPDGDARGLPGQIDRAERGGIRRVGYVDHADDLGAEVGVDGRVAVVSDDDALGDGDVVDVAGVVQLEANGERRDAVLYSFGEASGRTKLQMSTR